MRHFPIIAFFLVYSFFSNANAGSTVPQEAKPIDSTRLKSRGVFVTFSPFMLTSSIDTDTKENSVIYSGRIGVNWITKKHLKFQVFGALGLGLGLFRFPMKTNELGFTLGKLYKNKNNGFMEWSAGLSYFGRKITTFKNTGSFLDGTSSYSLTERQTHTFGIPFEATFYGSKLPVGLGVGLAGNLNLDQPYVGVIFRIRFGNAVLR